MEKLERDFEENDFEELDDVLDRSFFSQDAMEDPEEDESVYEVTQQDQRPLSEL